MSKPGMKRAPKETRGPIRSRRCILTYNFDPDQWYENQKALLEERLRSGAIKEEEFKESLEALDRKLEEMWRRLDGTYQIPD
jgi:hypothetical protein